MKRELLKDIEITVPEIFSDERGNFSENFNQKKFNGALKNNYSFVQDNKSFSKKGVFRGLHYQLNQPQGKLVQVLSGEVYDVILDLRKSSESFGDWMGIILSSKNRKQVWIPPGFAHGFLVLSDEAEFFYKVTDYWNQEDERCIKWSDKTIDIDFPEEPKNISIADQEGGLFKDADYFL